MNSKLLSLALFTFICLHVFSQNSWSAKANFAGTARWGAAGFVITSSNKAYIGTGVVNYSPSKDFWEYDLSSGVWTQKADFGGSVRKNAVGFAIGTKGYIGTGSNMASSADYSDFWEYNPATNSWTQKSNYAGGIIQNAVGFSIGNKGYMGTGKDNNGSSGILRYDFYEYDPSTNGWTQKADFGGSARESAIGFSIGSKGYIGTGDDGNDKNDFWEYNPSSNSWSQKASFGGAARREAVGFSIGTKGYIGTGASGNFVTYYQDLWEYSQVANSWTQKTNYLHTCSDAVGLASCTKGYIGTGATSSTNVYKDFAEYSPSTVPIAAFTASQTNFCAGTCINFTDASTIAPTSWSWTFPGATPSSSTSQNPTNICYNSSGTYTASLTVSNANCSLSTSQTITVNPLPTITVSPSSPSICTNSSFSMTAFGASTYSWSPSTGLSSTTGTTVTANPTSTTTYTITGTSSLGCVNSTTVTVTVLPLPNISITPTSSTICSGDSVSLTASGQATTYSWAPSTGLSSTSGATVIAKPTITTTYTITGTSTSGCINTTSITVTVLPLPNVSGGPNVTFCTGGSATLSASSGTSYSWTPTTGLSCTTCQNPIATPTTTTTYTVTVTDVNGCKNKANVTVNVTTFITANAGADSTICAGGSTTLKASGGTGFSWFPTNGLSMSTIFNPVASPLVTTTYSVIVTSGSCTPDTDEVTIFVKPTPKVPIINANGTILSSSSTSGNKWYLNGNAITGATSQFYTVNQNGFYTVCSDSNGCSSCSVPYNFTKMGIAGNSITDKFNIQPNPTNGSFTLKSEIVISSIQITNGLGQVIFDEEVNSKYKEIDLTPQSKGIYFILINTDMGYLNRKIILE